MVSEQVVTTNRRTSVITLLTINPREAGKTTTGDRNPQLNACPIVFTTHLTTRSFEGERKVVSKVVFFEKKKSIYLDFYHLVIFKFLKILVTYQMCETYTHLNLKKMILLFLFKIEHHISL